MTANVAYYQFISLQVYARCSLFYFGYKTLQVEDDQLYLQIFDLYMQNRGYKKGK